MENTIDDTISGGFLLLKMLLDLFLVITMPERVDIISDLFPFDLRPEFSACKNLVFHLQHHMAGRVVSAHVVLECENS